VGLAGSDRVDYEPTPWRVLGRMLQKDEIAEDDVFIDFGCGKGRVLIQAAAYPFGKIIGVELSRDLVETAKRNVERSLPTLRCKDIELVHIDVLDYDLPDDVTVVYFFNPFEGEVFRRVVEKLVASLRRRPRVMRIIYTNPVEENTLLQAGARLLKAANGFRPTKAWSRESSVRMYSLAAPSGAETSVRTP